MKGANNFGGKCMYKKCSKETTEFLFAGILEFRSQAEFYALHGARGGIWAGNYRNMQRT